MILLKKILIHTIRTALIVYVLLCIILYFFQEKILFHPERVDIDRPFSFDISCKELSITAGDGTKLNGLLFTTDSPKGLIFYLHGNAGSLRTWGELARIYIALHYDVFMLDYRGYGKSEGRISSEEQVFEDVQAAYDTMKLSYPENRITVSGYSIGTGPAAKLASANHARQLILQAPYYSLTDMMRETLPFLPTFLLRYKFATNEYIKNCKMPVLIFHGDQDEVIPYKQSIKIKPLLKPSDTLVILKGQGHNGITENKDYQSALSKLLL